MKKSDQMDPQLLEPGYGGQLTDEEYRFVYQFLRRNSKLRSMWGYRRGKGWRLSEDSIRFRAMYGPPGNSEYPHMKKSEWK